MKNSMPPKLQALMMGIAPKGSVKATIKNKKTVLPIKNKKPSTKKKKKVIKKNNKMGC